MLNKILLYTGNIMFVIFMILIIYGSITDNPFNLIYLLLPIGLMVSGIGFEFFERYKL